MAIVLQLVLLVPCAATVAQPQPHGLLADFQSGLALGVSEKPSFAWIVPPCVSSITMGSGLVGGQQQTAYQIQVSEEVVPAGGAASSPTYRLVWDSGRVGGNASANVMYGGQALVPGSVYVWTVNTWSITTTAAAAAAAPVSVSATQSCGSAPSERSRFVTALFAGFAKGTAWVWPAKAWDSRFVFMRRVVNVDDTSAAGGGACAAGTAESSARAGTGAVARALLFVAATVDEAILSAFKVYIGGTLVAVGPGRGEAEVRGGAGHGTFARQPYITLDVTAHFQRRQGVGGVVLAVEAQSPMNDTTIDPWDPYERHMVAAPAGLLLQLAITKADGTRCTVITESASKQWTGASADRYYNPLRKRPGVWYNQVTENIDARAHSWVGWRTSVSPSPWPPVVPQLRGIGFAGLLPKMTRPMQLFTMLPTKPLFPAPAPRPPPPSPTVPPTPPTPPAPVVTQTCSVVTSKEGDPHLFLNLGCTSPNGMINSIAFASFGTPRGACPAAAAAAAAPLAIDPSCDAKLSTLAAQSLCLGNRNCSIPVGLQAAESLFGQPGPKCNATAPKKLAVQVTCSKRSGSGEMIADFGQEFQGGLVLDIPNGVAGQRVRIRGGELLGIHLPGKSESLPSGSGSAVSNTWGYEFVWTMRDGPQVLTQHNYMTFRYASFTFMDAPPPRGLNVSAWGVAYEWDPTDSDFDSSNATLNRVWALCENTLRFGVVGTYTDSNTRERRPYEADGMIAGAARALLQRDAMLSRHSASWIIEFPTWPIEWNQQLAVIAFQDYMSTGNVDLGMAYLDRLLENTKSQWVDKTSVIGVVPTPEPFAAEGHIVGWDPTPNASQFHDSDHMTPCNAWAVGGLEKLAEIAHAGGNATVAAMMTSRAATLRKAMLATMWDATTGRFCDGICADPKVGGHSSIYTDLAALYNHAVPAASVKGVWAHVAARGLEDLGAYGAYLVFNALAQNPGGDDGTLVLDTLTKCDLTSWCAEWELYNATMTMEGFPVAATDGNSLSHLWGTSAISGIVNNLLGITPTSPGFATFTVKPKLGSLQHATVKVPTLHGFISVAATPGRVAVNVPCNTWAHVCLMAPVELRDGPSQLAKLLVDGIVQENVVREGIHVCLVAPVGCGPRGADRALTFA